ncbi:unnamed protein product [Prunus armeniaca]
MGTSMFALRLKAFATRLRISDCGVTLGPGDLYRVQILVAPSSAPTVSKHESQHKILAHKYSIFGELH